MKRIIAKHAAVPILIGLGAILIVIRVEDGFWFRSNGYIAHGMKFLDHLGIAFLSLGVIGLILELPHWQSYFYQILLATITDEAYFEKIKDKTQLQKIQTKLMKAFFNTKDIDKPDSFFGYYREQIQQFIGEPYRDQTSGVTRIEYAKDQSNAFSVKEEISFFCRKLGTHIQKKTRWTAHRDELISMPCFRVTVTPPAGLSAQYGDLGPKVFEWNTASPPNPNDTPLRPADPDWGYEMSLEAYEGMDGLFIKTELEYVVASDRAFSWSMPYISKGLTHKITYPRELTISLDQFLLHESTEIERKPGVLDFAYREWLLPGDGIAFHFRKP